MTVTARESRRLAVAAALAILALLGFFQFPGHTFLQSDTQIYLPMFEQIEHPELYHGDPLVGTMHLSLTIYDEAAILLRRLTGFSFLHVLEGMQILFRVLGLWGIFLIATSFGCSDAAALFVSSVVGLGATIVGPAVLTVEYEPVPRGFALALLLLATGLTLQGRFWWACASASLALLIHGPATWPFWPLFLIALWRYKQWRALWPLAAGLVILAIAYAIQSGSHQPQPLLQTIDPAWEAIMRFRVAYDWVAQWPDYAVVNFAVMTLLACAALWRIRSEAKQTILLAGLPILGLISIAASASLLDIGKWSLMAQVQPARASLFAILFAQINCAIAAMLALKRKTWIEASLWLIPVMLPPVKQNFATGFTQSQIVTVLVLVAVAILTMSFANGRVAWILTGALASWMIPSYAKTENFPVLHSPDLEELSSWARAHTPETALFVFPNAQRSLVQGVFRAKALRPLWIDWKAGGQVNYFRDFALTWWRRWQELSSGKLTPADWRKRGVRYLVYMGSLPAAEPLPGAVFANKNYRVYDLGNPLEIKANP